MNILHELERLGGYIRDSHVVYTSGRHGSEYLNKDALYTDPGTVSRQCHELARRLTQSFVTPFAVIGPEKGGIILSQWTAFHIEVQYATVRAVFAEKEGDGFVLRRGYDELVRGKTVVIVEDVLTTGESVQKVIAAARALDCNVLAVGALFNRGKITAEILDVPFLFALADVNLESYPEDNCPLCREGRPINTKVGKGREFLARQATSSS